MYQRANIKSAASAINVVLSKCIDTFCKSRIIDSNWLNVQNDGKKYNLKQQQQQKMNNIAYATQVET